MVSQEEKRSDLLIKWPANRARIATILQTGRCPSNARPLKARHRATVAIADPDGKVMLLFTLLRIDHPASVLGANGKRYFCGCELVAVPGSMRRPASRDPKNLPVSRYPPGAISYIDIPLRKRVIYGDHVYGGDDGKTVPSHREPGRKRYKKVHRVPFKGTIQGLDRDHPEARLVREYAKFMGDTERFQQHVYRPGGFRCDLFDAQRNRLIEAKVNLSRESLRMAFGQLNDYRRFYSKGKHKRRPRIGVLLPAKPRTIDLRFLEHYKTVVIWRTQSRRTGFADNAHGGWTTPT